MGTGLMLLPCAASCSAANALGLRNRRACGQDLRGCCVRMQAVQQAMKAEYNDSQMAAVTAGLDRSPVILIQVSKC